ncbi:hypothetical protein CAOG_05183 [Capsaspora owczarzaki ATCC 30864]|uniref:Mini-chromosome maintenance complex-binding protein n=1 Tax=Capsaspora owczarzaki (strain ATCC 30864) TaxID=595528 RepID=A0A0D2UHH3_CAPO3|nr:hypothetical protein CAOG_05183 [Capsaspora owczarzaki ATCC 30864]KJE94551.1 hypothetical protein CAOG_005183 [Capsaspora owczarzaki ATCC 30864]|eukprot:XP_004346868.1 hypothetical protein CAOG_05183 [Capsaspora owczarzaki ATCC 30864]
MQELWLAQPLLVAQQILDANFANAFQEQIAEQQRAAAVLQQHGGAYASMFGRGGSHGAAIAAMVANDDAAANGNAAASSADAFARPAEMADTSLAYAQAIERHYLELLNDPSNYHRIPLVNNTPVSLLKPNTLVRFRCMIQDTADELSMGVAAFSVTDAAQQTRILSGLYRDHESIDECDHGSESLISRQTFVGIPIPGEAPWVQEHHQALALYHGAVSSDPVATPAATPSVRSKRGYEEDDEPAEPSLMLPTSNIVPPSVAKRVQSVADRAQLDRVTSQQANTPLSVADALSTCFPVPYQQAGPVCHIKIYHGYDDVKVASVLDVVGILTFEQDHFEEPVFEHEEFRPSSLVPRIHCITFTMPKSTNPLVPHAQSAVFAGERLAIAAQAQMLRSHAVDVFANILLGDQLAAEYLLLHLLSNVYVRRQLMACGKLSLNISNIPDLAESGMPSIASSANGLVNALARTVGALVPNSLLLPLTVNNLNTLRFRPFKNHTLGKLESGVFQLPHHTHLLVDETSLQPAQLEPRGTENCNTISNLLQWQSLEYDFEYHNITFNTDLQVLITSSGKSMFPADCHVPLEPVTSGVVDVLAQMDAATLERLRLYLTMARDFDYSFEQLESEVQNDFVAMRRADRTVTQETFSQLLVVSRLLSLSYGQPQLTPACWQRAKELEQLRVARCAAQSHR